MHESAVEAVKRNIGGVLRNCVFDNGWPIFGSITERLASLGKLLAKHKEPYLTDVAAFSIFYDLVPEAVRSEQGAGDSASGPLPSLIPAPSLATLESKILAFILSVPRDYDILLPLPTASHLPLTATDLAARVAIHVEAPTNDAQPKGLLLSALSGGWSTEIEPGKPYLRYRASGFVRSSLEGQTSRDALSGLKILLQQGMSRGLFSLTKSTSTPVTLASILGRDRYSVSKARLLCVDRGADPRPNFSIDLPLDVSRLIERIAFASENKALIVAASNQNLGSALKDMLRLPALLASSSTEESSRVRAASEWCFDSYASDSQTLAFLQVCIGLEALLGEDSESEAVTKTLADRCAYLLGTSVKGRATIRDNFRALYRVRSKIVHGNALTIAEREQIYLDWGRNILEYAIAKELKHLGLEKA